MEHFRCPARARTYTKEKRVEVVESSHNHPPNIPRRQHGEAQKLRQACIEKKKKAKR